MIEVKGKCGVTAKVLCHSISEAGIELISYEIQYPRMILAELNTHGMLCKNSSSSRAIPFAKMQEQLTARPVRFGQANPGMQDKGLDYDALVMLDEQWEYDVPYTSTVAWEKAKQSALGFSRAFHDAGYHKQVYNRLTEPFQMMKTVLSGTELANFNWLRNHGAADPTIEELARCMYEAKGQSEPELLKTGEYHLPYVTISRRHDGKRVYLEVDSEHGADELSTEDAIKMSCARTAAVSFRNCDYGLEKCLEVYERLIGDDRKHASAMQHAATPMKEPHRAATRLPSGQAVLDGPNSINVSTYPATWELGVSHADRQGQLWSAQYKGWIMWRKCIPGENYTG